MFKNGDDVAQSIEFKFLIDRAIVARQSGRFDVAEAFGRAAERLFEAGAPDLASDIAMIASRKGAGAVVARTLADRLSPVSAAAVAAIWLLRGARRPALRSLAGAFGDDETFRHAFYDLCRRLAT